MSEKGQRYLADIFTTCVDIRWRCAAGLLLLFPHVLAPSSARLLAGGVLLRRPAERRQMCVSNFHTSPPPPLFSVETQTTIGYATATSPRSAHAVFVWSPDIVGCITSTPHHRASWPRWPTPKRDETLVFSPYATVAMRDGKLCLMWRVGTCGRATCEAHVARSAPQVAHHPPRRVHPLTRRTSTGLRHRRGPHLFLVSPITIVHLIDEHSPSTHEQAGAGDVQFEIVVILEACGGHGHDHAVPQLLRASEVLWGHRFERCSSRRRTTTRCTTPASRTLRVPSTPHCTSRELAEKARPLRICRRF
ncbi:unnamed protein product [Boreogadus saida]